MLQQQQFGHRLCERILANAFDAWPKKQLEQPGEQVEWWRRFHQAKVTKVDLTCNRSGPGRAERADEVGLREWLMENERWVRERVVREAAQTIRKKGISDRCEGYGERDGANIDLELDSLTVKLEDGGTCLGATFYVQWRLGQGLQLRGSVQHYNDKLVDAKQAIERTLMEALLNGADKLNLDGWQRPMRQKGGKSAAVFQFNSKSGETWDVAKIVETVVEVVPPLKERLKVVVAEVQQRIGPGLQGDDVPTRGSPD